MRIQVRKTPLYKPAVYAKLLGRSDISLALLLQNDVVMSDKSICASEHLASHFGLVFDGINVFIGVPYKLWEAFSTIDWQAYDIDEEACSLRLLFNVDVERVECFKTNYGKISDTKQDVDRLSFVLPCSFSYTRKFAKSAILHICEMDEHNERTSEPPIAVTKVNFKQG